MAPRRRSTPSLPISKTGSVGEDCGCLRRRRDPRMPMVFAPTRTRTAKTVQRTMLQDRSLVRMVRRETLVGEGEYAFRCLHRCTPRYIRDHTLTSPNPVARRLTSEQIRPQPYFGPRGRRAPRRQSLHGPRLDSQQTAPVFKTRHSRPDRPCRYRLPAESCPRALQTQRRRGRTVSDVDAAEPRGALKAVARVLKDGEKTHVDDDWRRHDLLEHIAKVEGHLRDWRFGDRSENHLANACTRLLFALQLESASAPLTDARAMAKEKYQLSNGG
jgi:Domain of unknown function (DUF5664)